jgi:hypothetical protein
MSKFRGSDEQIDREIATLERTVHLRVRRAAAELRELERDLRELRKERARRKVAPSISAAESAGAIGGEP